jgi:hypothetical protein
LPEVVLLANVPEGNDSLLTFNEVSTLYHESVMDQTCLVPHSHNRVHCLTDMAT